MIERREPEFAQTVRACALLARIDVTLVGVVRGTPIDATRDEHVLEVLRGLSFVTVIDPETVAVDDGAREVLLADLRASDPDHLGAVNQRLKRHYLLEHDASLRLEGDLARVAHVVREQPRALPPGGGDCPQRCATP